MKRKLGSMMLILVLVVLAVTGCGGKDNDNTGKTDDVVAGGFARW